ncbi:hypothetical protein A3F00_02265, partial [Candidatus Daviesbacteria bacterium RIFCSPHIGHO2_12_FULL_37_11]
GGNKGIGRATVHRLAQEGALEVIILSRSSADEAIVQIDPFNTKGFWIACDLSDESSTAHAAEQVKKEVEAIGKRIKGLVNNAGITEKDLGSRGILYDFIGREHIEKMFQTNYIGPRMLTAHLLRRDLFDHAEPDTEPFVDQVPSIVNISSVRGKNWVMMGADYDASKAAVITWTKSITASVFQEYGYFIKANVVCPGFITTEMTDDIPPRLAAILKYSTPLRRFGTPEEVAAEVANLCSVDTGFTTGDVRSMDGGLGGGVSPSMLLYEAGVDFPKKG